ncbi:Crp/Fnr family transcriptional regulator [Hyalangium sp.]|uniref:Crp/Fnr family transcriptional regulator n=1 Tax=Hyalangium sp. TaxID=2028555 RepID=UPI002D712188|nr:Crp/Fnr family transcriptional regulator [Hyalangium sp.]HYI02132.1 Crp/Fnr family transcriptional regulator [Hyalangium sp.]
MSYAQFLAKVPMFEHLAQEQLEHLSGLLHARRYPKGEVIFHEGDVGTALFIIRKGQVAIRLSSLDGKEATLALLERGDFFGELALLDGEPRSTDAVAREETELLSLQQESFHRFLESSPQVALGLLASLSRLVRRVTRLVHDATFLDARTRLIRVLLELARSQGRPGTDGVVITQKLTQAELANLCGLTRESTNKWLRFFVREGLLSYEGGQITLVHPERLLQDAE